MTETNSSTRTKAIEINIRTSHLVMFLIGLFIFVLLFYRLVVPSLSHESKIQGLKQQVKFLEGQVEIYKFNDIQSGSIATITKVKDDQIERLETNLNKTKNQLNELFTSATTLVRANTKLEDDKTKLKAEKQKLIAEVERVNAKLNEVKCSEG